MALEKVAWNLSFTERAVKKAFTTLAADCEAVRSLGESGVEEWAEKQMGMLSGLSPTDVNDRH